jgi:hypothetical protein
MAKEEICPPWLPAATTSGTPASTTLQIASRRAVTWAVPHAAVDEPEAVRLMLATSMTPAFSATHSSPQISSLSHPLPELSSTLTE